MAKKSLFLKTDKTEKWRKSLGFLCYFRPIFILTLSYPCYKYTEL